MNVLLVLNFIIFFYINNRQENQPTTRHSNTQRIEIHTYNNFDLKL